MSAGIRQPAYQQFDVPFPRNQLLDKELMRLGWGMISLVVVSTREFLRCFDAFNWVTGRVSGLWKKPAPYTLSGSYSEQLMKENLGHIPSDSGSPQKCLLTDVLLLFCRLRSSRLVRCWVRQVYESSALGCSPLSHSLLFIYAMLRLVWNKLRRLMHHVRYQFRISRLLICIVYLRMHARW